MREFISLVFIVIPLDALAVCTAWADGGWGGLGIAFVFVPCSSLTSSCRGPSRSSPPSRR